ncbi:MAG: hypothetical protein HXY34_06195, partial [Candidatus Thorarchaeota archaeon]|nr:hypothetical protein [Candidatus Thorarchaeota archaeon]
LMTESSLEPVVLFIDEMEGPYNTFGEEGERKFLEVIKRVYNECSNVVIVSSCLSEIWDRIHGLADAPTQSRMEEAVRLRHFTKEDVEAFVTQSMKSYWDEQNLDPPPDPLFPLTGKEIEEAFKKSKGVPREAIRVLIGASDKILFGKKEAAVEPQSDYVLKLTPTVMVSAVVKAFQLTGKTKGYNVQTHVESGESESDVGAVVSIEKDGATHMIAIDVPTVKSWDRSAGVAAFYSAKRLKDAIGSGRAEVGLVVVPKKTKGAKFESVLSEMGSKLHVMPLTEQSAVAMFEATNTDATTPEEEALLASFIDRVFSAT